MTQYESFNNQLPQFFVIQVYMDISIGGDLAGRIEIGLFKDVVPKTSMNFKSLITNEKVCLKILFVKF